MYRNDRKKEARALAATFQRYTCIMLDVVACVYILLILVAMPFYHQEGYTHIGTDKSVFFFKAGISVGKIAVPRLTVSSFCCPMPFRAIKAKPCGVLRAGIWAFTGR